jgi:hypothetical protein
MTPTHLLVVEVGLAPDEHHQADVVHLLHECFCLCALDTGSPATR